MSSSSLISIIIPCHNAEHWIGEALKSCINQTHRPIEIIVIDDGSSDDSMTVVRDFNCPELKIIHQDPQGPCVARNRGLSEAHGEYFQFLDADDILDCRKLEIQLQRLRSDEPECIASSAWGRFYSTIESTEFKPEPIWRDLAPVDWIITTWSRSGTMPLHGWLTPRSVISRAGDWDASLPRNNDGEYFTRVILSSQSVLFCPEARVFYRSGLAQSISARNDGAALDSIYRSMEMCSRYLLEREDSPRTRRACANYFQRFVYNYYPQAPDLLQAAATRVQELGGADIQLLGSDASLWLARVVGWKAARRLQRAYRKVRYRTV